MRPAGSQRAATNLGQDSFHHLRLPDQPHRRTVGWVTMRDLLFTNSTARLSEVMLRESFYPKPDMPFAEAMRLVLDRNYPVCPVCDDEHVLVGLVAAIGMYAVAAYQPSPHALLLAVVVWLAMVGSCVASSISGADGAAHLEALTVPIQPPRRASFLPPPPTW